MFFVAAYLLTGLRYAGMDGCGDWRFRKGEKRRMTFGPNGQ